MKIQNVIIFAVLVLFLTACSGGGSSSGGPITENDGIFSGFATVTLSAAGTSDTEDIDLQVVVANNIVTSVTFGGLEEASSIPVVGNTVSLLFQDTVPVMLDDNINCTGSFEFAGMFSGDTLNGPINGALDCSMDGITVQIQISGSFTATRG